MERCREGERKKKRKIEMEKEWKRRKSGKGGENRNGLQYRTS